MCVCVSTFFLWTYNNELASFMDLQILIILYISQYCRKCRFFSVQRLSFGVQMKYNNLYISNICYKLCNYVYVCVSLITMNKTKKRFF